MFSTYLCNYTCSPLEGDINPTHDTMWILWHLCMSGSEWRWWESSWKSEELAQTVWLICLANSLWMNDQDQRAWEYSTQRTSYYFYSLTFGVNMWAMPSTAPFSSKPRTRKQKSTTYGKRELKYITLERKRESSTLQCYHGHAFLRSGLRKKDKNCNQTFHTHTWIKPKTALCLLGTESVKFYQMWREDSLRFGETSQKSFI